jgi:hypothetical protein
MSQTGDQPRAYRVDGGRNNDQGGRGRVLGGKGCGGRIRYDHVSVEPNHFRRKLLEPLHLALRIPALNGDVPSFHVPKLPETLKERLKISHGSVCDKTNPPPFACLRRICTAKSYDV